MKWSYFFFFWLQIMVHKLENLGSLGFYFLVCRKLFFCWYLLEDLVIALIYIYSYQISLLCVYQSINLVSLNPKKWDFYINVVEEIYFSSIKLLKWWNRILFMFFNKELKKLILLYLAFVLGKVILGFFINSPSALGDEYLYSKIARNLF